MKILIAEDDATTQRYYSATLELWGHELDVVDNGHEAVKLLDEQGHHYDLCLMDIEMPIMNGLEAIERLRQHLPNLPVVAFSSDAGYKKASLKAGANAFFSKPVLINELHGLLDTLVV